MFRVASLLLLFALALPGCAKKHVVETTTTNAAAAAASGTEIEANPMLPPKVFTDGVGIVVELVPLKAPEGGEAQALLRVTGVRSFISGVTFLVTRSPPSGPDAWTASIDGKVSFLLQSQPDQAGEIITRLHLPRTKGYGHKLTPRPDGPTLIKVDELIADYKSHLQDGSLGRLAKFDPVNARSAVEETTAAGLDEFRKQCEKEIEVEIDWETIVTRKQFDEASFCSTALKSLANICQVSASDKKEIGEKIDRVRCHYKEKLKLDYDAKKKTWDVGANSSGLSISKIGSRQVSSSIGLHATLLKSASGVYVVVPARHDADQNIYVSLGKKLYRQLRSKVSTRASFAVWGPTMSIGARVVEDGVWEAQCLRGPIRFREVDGEERDQVLKGYSRHPSLWQREALALARDDRGIYYYVDRKLAEFGGLDYRVFKGPRGGLSLTTMVDIVDDAQGQIFSTTKGALRLMFSKGYPETAKWLSGKKANELVIINPQATQELVFGDLGIYEGEETGTLCSLASAAALAP